ncbi:hypothetical protein [Micromonospora sp. IBHARD004]|uniref:hypothetical protein n=1 Tax=Micromonospora sp. IBHARD004 TaxID=3457764 RepID=UPI0040585CF8
MASTTTITRYRVISPCVMAKVPVSLGMSVRGRPSASTVMTFYRDALLPADVDQGDVTQLLDKNMVEEVQLNG